MVIFHSYVSLPEGNLLDNHSWGYTSPMFRQTPRFQDFGAWSTARGRAYGGHRWIKCLRGQLLSPWNLQKWVNCPSISHIISHIILYCIVLYCSILCVFIKVIRIPLIKIYRCGLYSRHHIYCTLVGYKCIFKVFVVCCNLRVSCLGSSNKFHSYIDVVTHVGDHFGKKSCRTIFRWRC